MDFFKFNPANRVWNLPVVAGLDIGLPLLLGLKFNNMEASIDGMCIRIIL